MLARVKQQEEEQKRQQQLQMQMQNVKGQQLISSILGRTAEAAPGKNPFLKGVNYNHSQAPSPSSAVSLPGSPARAKATGKVPSAATTAVSEAADELHRAELALIERRVRLAEAQEIAKNEAEAIAKVEAAVRMAQSSAAVTRAVDQPSAILAATRKSTAAAQELLLRKHAQIVAPATAPQPAPAASPPVDKMASAQKGTAGSPFITSLLEDLDNAFKTSAIPLPSPPTWVAPVTQVQGSPPNDSRREAATAASQATTTTNDQLKITDEELQRARAEAAAAPAPMDLVAQTAPTAGLKSPKSAASAIASGTGKSSPGPSASEREVILARLNAMEQIRLRDQHQQKKETERIQEQQKRSQQQQQLLMNFAKAEIDGKLPTGPVPSPSANTASSTVVREAIRNAAVGLIGGDNTSATTGLLSPRIETANAALEPLGELAERIKVQGLKSTPRLLSKEMMDMFAKTAAAAISSKSIDSSGSENSVGVSAPGESSRITSPPPSSLLKGITKPAPTTTTTTTSSSSSSKEGALAASIIGKAPAPSSPKKASLSPTKPPIPPSSVISNSELEAARALMRIPGTVKQPNGKSLAGHWELVRPEGLKKGTPLAKTLPQVVNKSSDLSHEAYRKLALKMSPPGVMRIPDNWDARKEPVYLVVDPTNAANPSLPPASAPNVSMAIDMPGAAPGPGNPVPAVALHQAAGPAAAFRTPGLR